MTTPRPARIRSAMLTPAEDAHIDRLPVWAGYLAGVLLPIVVALLLIPFREDLQQTAALLLIVPVVAVALLAGTGPALVAAVTAGASFGVLLTQPYGRFAIHNGTDVVATLVLVAVGLIVGATAIREHRAANRAELRRDELERLLAFAELSAADDRPGELLDAARGHLVALLHLDGCEWHGDLHPGDRPMLLEDGQIMGYVHDLPADRSQLPTSGVELVAQTADREIGWFLLVPVDGSTTSVEQRRTAAAIANLLAGAVARRDPPRRPASPTSTTAR